jgi:Xaa-Pro aminopeptidase
MLHALAHAIPAVASLLAPAPARAGDGSAEWRGAEAPPLASVIRSGDGLPACGLGKGFHAGRRRALAAELDGGLFVLRGLPEPRDYEVFQQDKVFWYLTGVESQDAALLLDAKRGTEVLFLPDPSRSHEVWNGELWDHADEWIGERTGFADVRPIDELERALEDLLDGRKRVWTSLAPSFGWAGGTDVAGPYDRRQQKDAFDGRTSRERAFAAALEERLDVEVEDARSILEELRRVKTSEELDAIRRASVAGAAAMVEAIRCSRPGIGEWELSAAMSFVHQRLGAEGPAYLPIVGSGPNSCALHYGAASRRARAGEVVLIDYAPQFDRYASDITRTWPVDGIWTPRMIELYDAVLEAQLAGIAAVKPGRSISAAQDACDAVIAARGLAKLVQHGVSHYVGLEVHDANPYAAPLEPGVVFTIEPGLYDAAAGIGVRIEDVVVVTADGCDVLSAGVPKDRESLTRLIAEHGLLDAPGASPAQPAPSDR